MATYSSDTDCYFSDFERNDSGKLSNVHNVSDLDISDGSSLASTDSSNTEITNNNDQNHDDWQKNFSAIRCEQFTGADHGPTTVLPGDTNELDFSS